MGETVPMSLTPLLFGARRIRAHPWSFAAVALALAAAGALIGWASVRAAEGQEESVRVRLQALPAAQRSFRVLYYTLPFERDVRAPGVMESMRSFADVGSAPRRIRIWHSLERGNPVGTRLVVTTDVARDLVVRAGRAPSPCETGVCEAVSVAGLDPIGARVRLAPDALAVVVGQGSLRPGLVPGSETGRRALLVHGISRPFAAAAAPHGSTVVTTSLLDPRRIHGYALETLSKRLRVAISRLEYGDDLLRGSAPVGVLDELVERASVTRNRLLIVAGECAALVIAFAAFVARMRRREAQTIDQQLTNLGATRGQVWIARLTEHVTPGVLGAAVAVLSTWAAARLVAAFRDLPAGFARVAVTWPTMLLIVATGVCGSLLLATSVERRRPTRHGVGVLEVAAVVVLGVLVWQASTTGALQPEDVARNGTAPVILLVPALAFFAAAIVLLRALPPALRLGERVTRRTPLARLAFVTAARNPLESAATTTFLSVVLGASLFSLGYLTTIDHQARDAARFAAGAPWRTIGPSYNGSYAIRTEGSIRASEGSDLSIRVLALPADRVPRVLGWRRSFSHLTRREIAQRLRPAPVKLTGPPLARQVTKLQAYARSRTDFPRTIVLHLLLPGQRFAELELGTVWRRWRLLRVDVPPRLRGAQLVALEYKPTTVPISFQYDPEGTVDLGPIRQRTAGAWVALPSLAGWNAASLPTGTAGLVYAQKFENAPTARGIRFEINGTLQPLIHPPAGLPAPLPGFTTGVLPALVGTRVAARATDGMVTLVVSGRPLPVRVIGTARLFPTVMDERSSFAVLDYDTLFAALNADQPGSERPTEAWFFGARAPPQQTLSASRIERRLRDDPLAAGTRAVLLVTAVVAALLAVIGLSLAALLTTAAERPMVAEYEAIGVAPRSLQRAAQLRLLLLSTLGIAAGVVGGLAGTRLIGALVAVTGSARRPLPPIVTVVAWAADAAVISTVAIAAVVVAALVVRRSRRGSTAERLRA
jgi:hypothetical protein